MVSLKAFAYNFFPFFSNLTLCWIYCLPGSSEARVHHLVIGGEADVECVSITYQVFRWDMTAVCS